MEVVRERDYVLLFLDAKRKFLIRAEKGKTLHTHKGSIDIGSIIGKPFGLRVKSHLGHEFVVLKPRIADFIAKMRRKSQVMYPQDIGVIIMFAGIGPGDHVVEAGTGSGALTSALAYHVRPRGRVYSYDVREDMQNVARENLKKIGLLRYVELKNKDVVEGIDESDVDAVVLDMATPWLAVPNAYRSLKDSGYFVSFSPTIDQVMKTVEALKENDFVDVGTFEHMLRPIRVAKGKTRPEMMMIGHTGYITLARKAQSKC